MSKNKMRLETDSAAFEADVPRTAAPGLVHVSAFVLLGLAVAADCARAQETARDARRLNEGLPQAVQPPRNAFAENLVPRTRSGATSRDRPYAPINKPDDQTEIPEIEMFVGESRVFPTPGVARIAVGNGQIMTAAALDGKEVILFANGVGTSSLFVWNEDGRYQRVKVNIVPGDTTRVAREVASFLTTIPNAKASIVGDKVIVEGDSLADADLAKIEQLEKRYPQIVNFTSRLGWEPMVLLDVKVVEFPVSELREIGLKWSPAGGAAIAGVWSPSRRGHDGPYQVNIKTGQGNEPPVTNGGGESQGVQLTSSLNVLTGVNIGLNAQLNLLAQDGKAVVLSEPQLTARSGSKASFLAGGEFPYSVATRDGVTVMFKKYGVRLDVEPKVDRTGAVRATVDAEVSKIDPSVSTASGPALLTRTTRTEFNLRSGETMVLSGLIERDQSTNVDKVPLLGDIPVLGALFRSKRFQNRETELVVFVTPRIVDTGPPGQADRIESTHQRLGQQLGQKPYLSQPLQPGVDPAVDPRPSRPRESTPTSDTPDTPEPGASAEIAGIPQPVDSPAPVVTATPSVPVALQPAIASPEGDLLQATATASGGSALQVKQDKVAVRASPDPRGEHVLQLDRGAIVRLGEKAAVHSRGGWRHVVIGELQGWVPADSVRPIQPEPVVNRETPGATSSPDRQGRSLQIGAAPGLRASPGRRVTADASTNPPSDNAAARDHRVVLHRLALRVAPDINADVISHLVAGQQVRVLNQSPRRQWVAIEADGKRGWVSGQWLRPAGAQD